MYIRPKNLFLVAALGLHDNFIFARAFHEADLQLSLADRMSEAYRASAVTVSITSLANLLAMLVGVISPFKCVRVFSIYAGALYFEP